MTIHKFRPRSKAPPHAAFDLEIRIGPQRSVRIVGHSDLQPPLVEFRHDGDCLNLTCGQAAMIGEALIRAAGKAESS